jgi:hypothetical protein
MSVVGCSALMVACNKDTTTPVVDELRIVDDHNYSPRVRAFVAGANGTGDRDGTGTMLADSAEWYVEAALNFSYTDLGIEYDDAVVDSVYYTLPLDDGMASDEDAFSAYHTLGQQIAAANVNGESHVVIVDVTSENTGDALVLTAAYVVGSGYSKNPDTNYGTNDYWMWWNGGVYGSECKCSSNPNSSPQCADKRIQSRINTYLINQGQGVYMVSVETWTLDVSDDSNNNVISFMNYPVSGSPCGFKTYGTSTGGCNVCLTPTAMSFYTQGTWDVMGLIKADKCPNKTAQNCTVNGSLFSDLPYHRIQYRYGIIPKS